MSAMMLFHCDERVGKRGLVRKAVINLEYCHLLEEAPNHLWLDILTSEDFGHSWNRMTIATTLSEFMPKLLAARAAAERTSSATKTAEEGEE